MNENDEKKAAEVRQELQNASYYPFCWMSFFLALVAAYVFQTGAWSFFASVALGQLYMVWFLWYTSRRIFVSGQLFYALWAAVGWMVGDLLHQFSATSIVSQ